MALLVSQARDSLAQEVARVSEGMQVQIQMKNAQERDAYQSERVSVQVLVSHIPQVS